MTKIRTDRSIAIYILLSIVTCGIYSMYFIHSLAKDINKMCEGDEKNTPGLLIFMVLGICTCGIYTIYWYYMLADRIHGNANGKFGLSVTEDGAYILLWMVLGVFVCAILTYYGMHIIIKNTNLMAEAYNEGLEAQSFTFPPDFTV